MPVKLLHTNHLGEPGRKTRAFRKRQTNPPQDTRSSVGAPLPSHRAGVRQAGERNLPESYKRISLAPIVGDFPMLPI